MIKSFLFLAVLLTTAAPCWAAVVRLVEASPGVYRLEAEQFEGVAAVDLIINYDVGTLQITNVSQGALLQGTLFAGNPNQPGRVHIGAVSTEEISGSGTLASISGTVNQSPARILSVLVKLNDLTGRALTVSTFFPAAQILEDQTELEALQPQDSEITPPSSQDSSGSVSTRTSDVSSPWEKAEGEATAPAAIPEPYIEPAGERQYPADQRSDRVDAPYVDKRQLKISSVLDKFANYEGPRTLEKLRVLFNPGGVFIQQPEILLSDGKATLSIEFPVNGNKPPSVALRNARLLKSGPVANNRFKIRCIPKQGALSAKVIFLGGEELMEIPLTIAPWVSLEGLEVTEDKSLPEVDLDGDGLVTWQDMYILVANLLVQRTQIK